MRWPGSSEGHRISEYVEKNVLMPNISLSDASRARQGVCLLFFQMRLENKMKRKLASCVCECV